MKSFSKQNAHKVRQKMCQNMRTKMPFISSLLVFLLAISDHKTNGQNQKSCPLQHVDSCVTEFALTAQTRPLVADSDHAFDGLCRDVDHISRCLYSYGKRCLSKLQFEIITWLSASVVARVSRTCSPNNTALRAEAFAHAPCLNGVSRVQRTACVADLPRQTQWASKGGANPLHVICCAISTARTCLHALHARVCTSSHAHFFDRWTSMADIVCVEPKEKSCDESVAPIGWKASSRDRSSALSRVVSALLGQSEEDNQ